MAGSYQHLRLNPDSYGGVDTSLCENMGDAIEAMVHMYWMIQIMGKEKYPLYIQKIAEQATQIEAGSKTLEDF